jgi:hypothetical protein
MVFGCDCDSKFDKRSAPRNPENDPVGVDLESTLSSSLIVVQDQSCII